MTTASDSLLLKKWNEASDARAFNTLVSRYAGLVHAAALRIVRNADDAEDIAQECFLRLARKPPRDGATVAPWLHRVAVNQSLDFAKSDRRRKTRELLYSEQSDAGLQPTWNDLKDLIDEAIDDVPDDIREALVSYFLLGKRQEDIARESGIARRTAGKRIQRGVEHVRKTLMQKGVTVPAALLSGMVLANAIQPAPTSLASSLGRLAIAPPREAAPCGMMHTASMLAKNPLVVLGMASVALLALSVYYYSGQSNNQSLSGTEVTMATGDNALRSENNAVISRETDAYTPAQDAPAQTVVQVPEEPEAATTVNVALAQEAGSIAGHVYLNGDPLPYAQVSIRSVPGGNRLSGMLDVDEDGFYRLEDIPPYQGSIRGTLHIDRVTKAGLYIDAVVAPDLITEIDFHFQSGSATIEGTAHLIDSDGNLQALEGSAQVLYQQAEEKVTNQEDMRARIDDSGTFRLENLAPGFVYLDINLWSTPSFTRHRQQFDLSDGQNVQTEFLLHPTQIDCSADNLPPQAQELIVYALPGAHEPSDEISPAYRIYVDDNMSSLIMGIEGKGTMTGLAPGIYTILFAAVPARGQMEVHAEGSDFYKKARTMQVQIDLTIENSPLSLSVRFPDE